MTDPQQDSYQGAYARELEKQAYLKRWREQKQAEKDQEERQRKQQALEEDLAQRARLYYDHTASMPTPSLMERWRDEHVDRVQRKAQAEREARLREVEAEHYNF